MKKLRQAPKQTGKIKLLCDAKTTVTVRTIECIEKWKRLYPNLKVAE